MRCLAIVVSSVSLASCARERVTEVVDAGRACVTSSASPTEAAQQFFADQPAFVQYGLAQCLSSSCDVDREGSCTVTRDGKTITVTSRFRWVDLSQHDENTACTDDCSGILATCETDPLPEGTYELQFGGAASMALTVPSQHSESPCLDVEAVQ